MAPVRAMHVMMPVHAPVVHTVRSHTAMLHSHALAPVTPIAVVTISVPSSIALPVFAPVVVPVSASAVLRIGKLSGEHQCQ